MESKRDLVVLHVGVRVLAGVLPVLEHDEHADVVGRLRPAHVAADVRREVAAGAGVQRRRERHGQRQRPHRLGLGLLLERDREHPLVDAGLRRAGWRRSLVEPPTLPAVCTRNSGLPVAPSASARYSSGIIMPSKKSGALPITTASMSAQVICGVVERARVAASRTSPAIDTSPRVDWCLVWPIPTTATRSLPISVVFLPGRTPGSAAGTDPTWRGRRPGRPRRSGCGSRPRPCG